MSKLFSAAQYAQSPCIPVHRFTPMAFAMLVLGSPLARAEDASRATLDEVVVTTVADTSPVTVVTDPKLPRQPMPASDAADYLKTIPGFNAIRSGGTNGDPVFRGMFGSRLPILTDGTVMLGACQSRMDAPSSYISPQAYDVLTLVKGPQTVLWGPGTSAGVVRFDREKPDFSAQPIQFDGSLLLGSAGRNDQSFDLAAGNERFYARLAGAHSRSEDYEDGTGRKVPSMWDKWSSDMTLGWTPDAKTRIELTAGAGNGHARYGGRELDGVKFRRDSANLRLETQDLTQTLAKLEAQLYVNDADHVMDNFTLRSFSPEGGISKPLAVNPDRRTIGGRAAITWQLGRHWELVTGADYRTSRLRFRGAEKGQAYEDKPRTLDARLGNLGMFGELTWHLADAHRLVGGLRVDWARAQRYGLPQNGPANASDFNHDRRNAAPSGFIRWEHDVPDAQASVYAGIGHVRRFPDYWELFAPSNSKPESGDAFNLLEPEKTTQIDIGAKWRMGNGQAWMSGYVGRISDYILFDYSSGNWARVRNVNAAIAGAELGASYPISETWDLLGALAYAWGRNITDGTALPQMPPLEARIGANYSHGAWRGGLLWRVVAAQHRHADGMGNVVGKDHGPSPGFGVMSLNVGYVVRKGVTLTAGVDNLFNRTYAEHLNLSGNTVFGYTGMTPINEPGRTLWLRTDVKF